MTINARRKPTAIDVVNRGGEPDARKTVAINLRIPKPMHRQIKLKLAEQIIPVSMAKWILTAIADKLGGP